MAIPITCGPCTASFTVPDGLAGKSFMCPECGGFMDIPKPGERPVAVAVEEDEGPEELSPKELKRLIREALEGDIPRVRRTFGYRLAIACVAFAMLLLPTTYIAMVVGVAVGLCWHAYANLDLFRTVGIRLALLLYVGPLIAGIVLLAFLVKPLLARQPRSRGGRRVRLDKEPVLAAFVTVISRAVHAPEPRQVAVDCHVNASAGFSGGLLGLFGRNLTLTIGLPLVEGLNARQLAGILAHEFGHFSQGAGMRLSFVVRSINHWFACLVYQRDAWDEELDEWCKESGYLNLIGHLVRGCVMLTRAILWVFMQFGNILSGFLLRRMEYDADRSEARLAGIRTFEKTSRRMAVLDAANVEAVEVLNGCWMKERYPDDFAALVVGLARGFTPRERDRIQEELEDARTGPFDSHPSFTDRLASVEREDPRGVFRLDLPATALFRTLPKLAAAASLEHYRGMFGRGIRPTLRPVADYLKGKAR